MHPHVSVPDRMVPDTIPAHRIRWLRQQRGMSVRDLAIATGYSPSLISRIERGQRKLSLPALYRFARIFRVEPHVLFAPPSILHGGSGGGSHGGSGGGSGGDGGQGQFSAFNLADEEAVLAGCWALFYRSGVATATPLVYQAIRRIEPYLATERHARRIFGQFHQLAGVLARDRNHHTTAVRHGYLAVDLARAEGDIPLLAAALFRLGRSLIAQQAYREAMEVSAEAAALAPRCGQTLQGWLPLNMVDILRESEDMALPVLGRQYIQQAEEIWERHGSVNDGSFTTLNEAGIAHSRAQLFLAAGAPLRDCLDALERAKATLPREMGRWSLKLATTEVQIYAAHGEMDTAVTLALPLLHDAKAAGRTTWRHLTESLADLQARDPIHPQVMALGDAIRAVR